MPNKNIHVYLHTVNCTVQCTLRVQHTACITTTTRLIRPHGRKTRPGRIVNAFHQKRERSVLPDNYHTNLLPEMNMDLDINPKVLLFLMDLDFMISD